MLTVTCIRTLEELSAYVPEWNRLVEQSPESNFFLDWDWVSSWIEAYWLHDRLFTVLVADDDRLLAAAPLWIDQMRFFAPFRFRVLRLFGAKEGCADHVDFLVGRKRQKEAIGAIWNYLFHTKGIRWDALAYHDVPDNSRLLDEIFQLAETEDKCIRNSIDGYSVSPYIELPPSWDEYLASLSANQRRALKLSLDRLSQSGTLRLEFCRDETELDTDMKRLIEINRRSWNKRGFPGSFASREFEAFHLAVSRRLLRKGELFLCALWLDDRHIGSFYGFQSNNSVLFYIFGVEKDFVEGASIGRVLLGMCIKEAIARGCKEFNLLKGYERYKFDWTDRSRRNLSITIYKRSIRSFCFLFLKFVREYSKQLIKAILGRRINTIKRLVRSDPQQAN